MSWNDLDGHYECENLPGMGVVLGKLELVLSNDIGELVKYNEAH